MQIFSSNDNICICAMEIAVIFGVNEINIYGIDLCSRNYFYGGGRGGYEERVANHMNDLIELCEDNNVRVYIHGSEECKLINRRRDERLC